jgi:NADPH:quinone reductase-like Zn-dependent oxidoreductase
VLLATGVDGNGSPGFECAGTVTRVGEGVDGLAAGDGHGTLASGAFAPFRHRPRRVVLPLPGGFDFVDAATVPVAFLTAWYGLYRLAHVAPGERVLIHSAAGGVGSLR